MKVDASKTVVLKQSAWNERAACKDIQGERYFSDDCWHIVRIYHRARRMCGTEAPCESWFSALKLLYDPRHGPSIGSLAERMELRIAGLRGNGADDAFVERLASHICENKQIRTTALERYAEYAHAEWQKRPLLLDDDLQLPRAWGRKLRKEVAGERQAFTKSELETSSKKLLAEHNQLWRLPLYAATKKQWQKDRARDTSQSERARSWKTKGVLKSVVKKFGQRPFCIC